MTIRQLQTIFAGVKKQFDPSRSEINSKFGVNYQLGQIADKAYTVRMLNDKESINILEQIIVHAAEAINLLSKEVIKV